jgi:serine/threonine-protein kinase HipA
VIDLSRPIKHLVVNIDTRPGGDLYRESQYRFEYAQAARDPVSLIMPREDHQEYRHGALFAVMDMNLPEGFLLVQIRERFPKQPPSPMHLLALMKSNGIGWLSYREPAGQSRRPPAAVDRARLLRNGAGKDGTTFRELVDTYLDSGSGLSGVQPKIMVPERGTFPMPNLIVKSGGPQYPGLVANEYLCLQVAQKAGIQVSGHELSDDGSLLIIERFDLLPDGGRLGFEDIAALLDLRVGGALSDRKYHGSYEDVASVIGDVVTEETWRQRLFEQVALTALVRNGDGHLKNFGVVYKSLSDVRLAPAYDVLTTTIYPYERSNGALITDRTMALKLFRRGGNRSYPSRESLEAFGRDVCFTRDPGSAIERIRAAMVDVMAQHKGDERLPEPMRAGLMTEWIDSIAWYAPA